MQILDHHVRSNNQEAHLAAQFRETFDLQDYHDGFFRFFRFPSEGPGTPRPIAAASC